MKRLFILFAAAIMTVGVIAQEQIQFNAVNHEINTSLRYKLYPTQNKWTFLELDTQTGRIWQVQYSVDGPEYRFKSNLNIWSLLKDNDLQVSGRFELYPTQNIYNFVLLDKISGRAWQVQWSTENDRGCWEIL
jgi:hypothetical protein